MIKILNFLLLSTTLVLAQTLISAGGFDVSKRKACFSFHASNLPCENVNITKVLQEESYNTNSVALWITKDWEEGWYDVETTQKEIIDKGYTPMFIFYWFADEINPQYVEDNKAAYFQALKRFLVYLKKLDGQKIVILNPEYNMDGTEAYKPMNKLFLESYKLVREDKQTVVGPCVGDFGDYNYVDEPDEWDLFDPSLNEAAKEADFIAFQEMRASTRNTPAQIINTAQRAYNFSKYLQKKYNKPTLLAYVALSSYGKNGEKIQEEAYKRFVSYLPKMKKEAQLELLGTFHYFDYPGHVGYFNKAEEYFGVLRKDGTPKPAFKYYNMLK